MQMNAPAPAYSHKPNFIMQVMSYVALAFGISAAAAYFAPVIIPQSFLLGGGVWAIYIATLVLAFTSHMWSNLARPLNFIMFTVFAAVIGFMFYPLLAYSLAVGGIEIVYKAFGATALLALAAGSYAQSTSRDLSGLGGFFSMAIIGLIVVSIINAIWYNGMVEMIVSGAGVLIFSGLIAYEIQMLKNFPEDRAMEAGIMLFIALYNLFTSVLRLFLAFGRD